MGGHLITSLTISVKNFIKLVIPTRLQTVICKWLHSAHLGIEKTLAKARMHYFWHGITSDIKELVQNCLICEKFKRNNQKETLVQDKTPEYPWQRIAIDIFEYAGSDNIAIIDAYSCYLWSERLRNKTSGHMNEVLNYFFYRLGYPTEIRSGNSPFGSREFEKFANETNILFKFSSPRYPQSNGHAEKGVAIAKNILIRCYEGDSVDEFAYRILEYNSTPVASMKATPAQLFFGRQIKTKLPITDGLLRHAEVEHSVI